MSVITCFYSTIDHSCDKPGCHSVLVLDGNMKNARQVCGCRDVGELKFAGMNGSVVVGMYIISKFNTMHVLNIKWPVGKWTLF